MSEIIILILGIMGVVSISSLIGLKILEATREK